MVTIIHILSDANLSGAPMHVALLSRGLIEKSFRCEVIGPEGPARGLFEEQGIPYHCIHFPSKFALRSLVGLQSLMRQIVQQRDSGEVIIHCHGPRAGLFGRLASRRLGVPIVYTEHSWTSEYRLPNLINQRLQLRLLRLLDRFTTKTVAVSDSVAQFLISKQIVPSSKLIRIYNGVELPKNTNITEPSLVIGSIGSLTWQKNYAFLIRAFKEVHRLNPEVRLEIIGEGPLRRDLEELVEQCDLGSSVTLHGAMPHDKVMIRLQSWGLYVQSSVNESFGLGVVEAIAHGVPSLVSHKGSLPEVVGTSDACFALGAPTTLSKKINHFLTDSTARAKLWQDEHAHVQQFSAQKMVANYALLYGELTANHKQKGN